MVDWAAGLVSAERAGASKKLSASAPGSSLGGGRSSSESDWSAHCILNEHRRGRGRGGSKEGEGKGKERGGKKKGKKRKKGKGNNREAGTTTQRGRERLKGGVCV